MAKDDMPGDRSRGNSSVRLSGRQLALYKALSELDVAVAGIYRGAMIALSQDRNPEKLVQAAHSLRELMDRIPDYLDVPVKARRQSGGDKMRSLVAAFRRAVDETDCHDSGEWNGCIDVPLRRFLCQLERDLNWIDSHLGRRKQEAAKIIRALDVSGRPMPETIERSNVDVWDAIREFFVGVAHHRATTEEEFDSYMGALEGFLLERMRPRTFDDFAELDALIREGEADDQTRNG